MAQTNHGLSNGTNGRIKEEGTLRKTLKDMGIQSDVIEKVKGVPDGGNIEADTFLGDSIQSNMPSVCIRKYQGITILIFLSLSLMAEARLQYSLRLDLQAIFWSKIKALYISSWWSESAGAGNQELDSDPGFILTS